MDNEHLKIFDPKAWEIRNHLWAEAFRRSIDYIAVYNAVAEAGVIQNVAPNALRATVHPKPGQLGIYAVNQHSHDVFPHHGQGAMDTPACQPNVEKIRIRFRADLQRQQREAVALTLCPKKFPFSDGKHPFVFVPNA